MDFGEKCNLIPKLIPKLIAVKRRVPFLRVQVLQAWTEVELLKDNVCVVFQTVGFELRGLLTSVDEYSRELPQYLLREEARHTQSSACFLLQGNR